MNLSLENPGNHLATVSILDEVVKRLLGTTVPELGPALNGIPELQIDRIKDLEKDYFNHYPKDNYHNTLLDKSILSQGEFEALQKKGLFLSSLSIIEPSGYCGWFKYSRSIGRPRMIFAYNTRSGAASVVQTNMRNWPAESQGWNIYSLYPGRRDWIAWKSCNRRVCFEFIQMDPPHYLSPGRMSANTTIPDELLQEMSNNRDIHWWDSPTHDGNMIENPFYVEEDAAANITVDAERFFSLYQSHLDNDRAEQQRTEPRT